MSIAEAAKREWKDQHVHPLGFKTRRGLNWFTVGLLYAMFYMCRHACPTITKTTATGCNLHCRNLGARNS